MLLQLDEHDKAKKTEKRLYIIMGINMIEKEKKNTFR